MSSESLSAASDNLPSAVADDSAVAPDIPVAAGRYGVLALVCTLSMITYLDRVCFGVAAPSIAGELGLSSTAELKWAFTAFAIAYAVFEIPSGWMGDRLGPRTTLIRIVTWWSICTALTGVIGWTWGGFVWGGLGTLITLRFLFGAGEAGAYPNITRAIHNWFPPEQWEFAQGFVWMSGRLMGGITPLIWACLVTGTSWSSPLVNWRGAFLIFGVIGLLWCVLFRFTFRNHPPSARSDVSDTTDTASETGTDSHHAIPWKWMLTNRGLLALCAMYSLLNYGWAFNITYFPSYLQQRFGEETSPTLMAVYLGAPLWIGALGCVGGGYCVSLIDLAIRNRRRSRQILGSLAMLGCAICWASARQTDNLHVFCLSVAFAAFCVDLTLGAAWATCQDIGRQHAAVVAATMNTVGTLGAAAAGWLTGTIVEQTVARQALQLGVTIPDMLPAEITAAQMAGYSTVFATYAGMYILAALLWQFSGRSDATTVRPTP